MTPAQKTTLKAAILADPTASQKATQLDYDWIANWFNTVGSFVVWRKGVSQPEVGKNVLYVAIANLTALNQTRLQLFLQLNAAGFDGNSDIDTMLQDVFSGALGGAGAGTRANLSAMVRRTARRAEQLLATGTGTTNSPATLGFEGEISVFEIGGILA